MQLNDVVLSYKEEMVSQLCKLISMPSRSRASRCKTSICTSPMS